MNNLTKLLYRFRAAIAFVVLGVTAFILIFNNTYYQQTQIYGALRHIQDYWHVTMGKLAEYTALKDDNERLLIDNAILRNQIMYCQNADSLHKRREYAPRRYTCIPARVSGGAVNKQHNYLSIDIGSNDRIHSDMGVVSNNCAVGIVVDASPHFATVMPIINRNTKISARLKRSGHIGSLMWDGVYYREALLTEVPQHAAVATGDTIVTSGYSALFPEGIIIGTVIDYKIKRGSFYEIRVRLAVDFNKLKYVEVIDDILQTEQRILEERQPNF